MTQPKKENKFYNEEEYPLSLITTTQWIKKNPIYFFLQKVIINENY